MSEATVSDPTRCYLATRTIAQRSYALFGRPYRFQAQLIVDHADGTWTVAYKSATKDTEAEAVKLAKAWLAKNASYVEVSK